MLLRKLAIVVCAVVITDPFLQVRRCDGLYCCTMQRAHLSATWCLCVLQVFAGSFVLMLALTVALIVRPYQSKLMNVLEAASLGVMLVTQVRAWLPRGTHVCGSTNPQTPY